MAKNDLTAAHYGTFLLSSIAGICMMNLVSFLNSKAGTMSWFVILVNSLFTLAALFLIAFVVKKANYEDTLLVFRGGLGKFLGTVVYVVLLFYLLLIATFSMRVFLYIVNVFFLPETPVLVLGCLLVLPVLYAVYHGIRVFGHTTTILWLFIFLFGILFLFAKKNNTWYYLFPLWNQGGFKEILPALPLLLITSFGLIGSFLLLPSVCNPQKIKKNILIFFAASMLLMAFVYIFGTVHFGPNVEAAVFPFYNLSTSYKGRFLERLDIIYSLVIIPVLGLYVSSFFTVFYVAQKKLFKKINQRRPGTILLLFGGIMVLLSAFVPLPKDLWGILLFENITNLVVCGGLLLIYSIYILRRRIGFHG